MTQEKIRRTSDKRLRDQLTKWFKYLETAIAAGTLSKWPIIKKSIETGESFTIPLGYQMLVWNEFTIDGGDLTVIGEMVIIEAP